MSAPAIPTRTQHKREASVSTKKDQATAMPALMSVPDAAAFLGLSRASAYRYAEAGLLPTKRFGRRVYVVRARLNELLQSGDAPEAA
jgi:predicted DNA-binding transcriptional regulator AlpA